MSKDRLQGAAPSSANETSPEKKHLSFFFLDDSSEGQRWLPCAPDTLVRFHLSGSQLPSFVPIRARILEYNDTTRKFTISFFNEKEQRAEDMEVAAEEVIEQNPGFQFMQMDGRTIGSSEVQTTPPASVRFRRLSYSQDFWLPQGADVAIRVPRTAGGTTLGVIQSYNESYDSFFVFFYDRETHIRKEIPKQKFLDANPNLKFIYEKELQYPEPLSSQESKVKEGVGKTIGRKIRQLFGGGQPR